ncbi:transposase [Nonomuraea sp. NPDC046802]|uniref:transposase n=1 Tax=Nonomuraea sp. NPDC046802 TaxID=3154919 RepID=UPI0033E59D93
MRAEIDALFTEGRDLVEVIEDVARLGARLIIQTAVEAEVDAFLGRARYQRANAATSSDEAHAARPGHRNGHCPTTIKTTTGAVTIARPKLRGTTEAFASRLFGAGVTRTNALETLVIASFVRGLSVRDVEGAVDAVNITGSLFTSQYATSKIQPAAAITTYGSAYGCCPGRPASPASTSVAASSASLTTAPIAKSSRPTPTGSPRTGSTTHSAPVPTT